MTSSIDSHLQYYARRIGLDVATDLEIACLDGECLESLDTLDCLAKYKKLKLLSMNNLGLKSLQTFPAGTAITSLSLNDNYISSGWECLIPLVELQELELGGNNIKSVKDIECLAKLHKLEYLGLKKCAVTTTHGYCRALFDIIPSLKAIDDESADGFCLDSSYSEDSYSGDGIFSDGSDEQEYSDNSYQQE